jgi:hypothetical protein
MTKSAIAPKTQQSSPLKQHFRKPQKANLESLCGRFAKHEKILKAAMPDS